jgi:ketosteroid isomerase-like protein
MELDLNQLDLVVRDMEATIAFYRALGVQIPEEAIWRTPTGAHHVDLTMPGGLILHFDSAALAKTYDRGWREPSGADTRNVLTFRAPSREWSDRFQAKDIDWIIELHWDDARQLPPGAPAVVGGEALRAAWQKMADTEGLTLKWEPTHADVSGDLAYDVGKGALTTPDGVTRPVKYVVVWERRGGQWRILVDMSNRDE